MWWWLTLRFRASCFVRFKGKLVGDANLQVWSSCRTSAYLGSFFGWLVAKVLVLSEEDFPTPLANI